MGTHSSASKLLEFVKQSRQRHPYEWCFLFTKLPRVNLNIMPCCCRNDYIKRIAEYSRPLFAELMEEFLVNSSLDEFFELSSDLLNSLTKYVMDKVVARKAIFKNEFGRHGQICLFLNAYYPGISMNMESSESSEVWSLSPLVNFHFANLNVNGNPCVIFSSGNLENENRFDHVSCFPEIKDDILLYLCFMGGFESYPFRDEKNNRISYVQARKELFASTKANAMVIIDSNSNRISNDGSFYEAALSSVICAASHYGGFQQGTLFPKFLEEVLKELSFDCKISVDLKKHFGANEILHFLANFNVPFLSPTNVAWPEWLLALNTQNNDFWLGNMERTKTLIELIYQHHVESLENAKIEETE
jgi:hypothetical protein